MATIFWAFLLRFGQAGVDASLTLVVGAMTAAILRRFLTPAGTRHLFGSGVRGLVRGWLAGMLLPVCSLGVIPVAREMRRAGVPGGTVLAFTLAAPLLNPISFLYGLTLAEPKTIACFALFSLVLSTVAGFLWDKLFAARTDPAETAARAALADADPVPAAGPRRLLAVVVSAAKELSGRDLLYYLVGIAGTALLSAAIPFGALQHSMLHTDHLAPLHMAALGVPMFTSPLSGMMKIGQMFDHGNSIGAAFVLFALGIGTSLGTALWMVVDYDWRRVLPWMLVYVGVVIALGYAAEPLLFDSRKAQLDHTHAFDEYSSPFPADSTNLPGMTAAKLNEKFGPLDRPAVYTLAVLILGGLVLRRLDRHGRVERWLTAPKAAITGTRPKWDVDVPGWVLGGVGIAGLVVFSVVGTYVFYPDAKDCYQLMETPRTQSTSALVTMSMSPTAIDPATVDATILGLEQWDLLVRKLEVGVYLRKFRVSPEQSEAATEVREAIEEVRDALREKEPLKAKRLYILTADQKPVRDALLVRGDLAAAREQVEKIDRKRTADTSQPPRLLSDELGPVWTAIVAGDLAAAQAVAADWGMAAVTLDEAHRAFRDAFPP